MIDRDGAALLAQIAATLLVAVAVSSFINVRVTSAYNRFLYVVEALLSMALVVLLIVTTNAAAAGDKITGGTYTWVVALCFVSVPLFALLTGVSLAGRAIERSRKSS